MSPAIALEGVGKRYWKIEDRPTLLRSLLPHRRPPREELWALRGIDLELAAGETLGIIGRNGAGKTSLLRLLAGVSQPTEGRITIRGRVAPLIGVGVGFHQEMTGRENVLVNGMLLGLTRDEVEEQFDEIVAFAELADFIDTPVKFYSSGMFMRLGFAVAVHSRPEVLLVDEVLAVGDLAFQLKCFERMRELKAAGTTILLVSHSMHAVQLLCPRTIVLRRGRIELDGPTEEAIGLHHQLLSVAGEDDAGAPVQIVERALEGPDGPADHLQPGVPAALRTVLRFREPVDSPQVHFNIVSADGTVAYELRSVLNRRHRRFAAGEEAIATAAFTTRLGGGTYRLHVTVTSQDGREELARDHEGLLVYIAPRSGTSGLADVEATITLDDEVLSDYPDMRI